MRSLALQIALACLVWGYACRAASSADLPQVDIVSVRRVFHNGEHNAFTDLCSFQGRYYLTLRSCPDGHGVHPSASVIVLSSVDGQDWRTVHRFHVAGRDTRDPHFLVFHDKLFVYTGTWYCGAAAPKHRDLNQHLGYAAWTADGAAWHGPRLLEGTYGHYVWRAAAHGGKAWLCGRRKRDFADSTEPEPAAIESALLESDDGLVWRTAGLFQEQYGDETAFQFLADGSILSLSRSYGNRPAQIGRAKPPYTSFQRLDLDRAVGGPLLVNWDGHWLVGGRKTVAEPRTALSWLADDRLYEIAELPSGGDNSYPGFVNLGGGRAWLSYYSSHEHDDAGRAITAIYLAELRLASR